MGSAPRVCSTHGCPVFIPAGGRCPRCTAENDRARGTASERGYNSPGHRRFRRDVLDRDPICVACELRTATVADHWPRSRRELIAAGLDPNDPAHGRGVCKRCHDRSTAAHQPGGWHQPST